MIEESFSYEHCIEVLKYVHDVCEKQFDTHHCCGDCRFRKKGEENCPWCIDGGETYDFWDYGVPCDWWDKRANYGVHGRNLMDWDAKNELVKELKENDNDK